MNGINRIILLGNLGADPKLYESPGKRSVCTFRLATTERWKDSVHTEWHQIKAFGDQAAACAKYLKKGRAVFIEGRVRFSTYQDKAGNTRGSYEVAADQVIFVSNEGREERPPEDANDKAERPDLPPVAPPEDDLPF